MQLQWQLAAGANYQQLHATLYGATQTATTAQTHVRDEVAPGIPFAK